MSNVTRVAPLVTAHVNLASNPAAAGDSVLLSAVSGTKYRVLAAAVISAVANTVTFKSSTAGAISAAFAFGANGGFVLPFNEHGWFETAVGEGLNVNLSGATAVAIQLQYIKITAGV